MYAGFIFHHFQYAARASFDATPASATITFNYTDDFVSALLLAMQVKENPQQSHHTCSNVYYVHRFVIFISLSTYADK
jgi:hypothetical protein